MFKRGFYTEVFVVNESTQRRWKNGIVGYTGKVSLDPINLTPFKGEYPSVRDCLWNIHISYWLWLFVEVGGAWKGHLSPTYCVSCLFVWFGKDQSISKTLLLHFSSNYKTNKHCKGDFEFLKSDDSLFFRWTKEELTLWEINCAQWIQ